jgi:site-specific recombinase XerD
MSGENTTPIAHLTPQALLLPAILNWESYLLDQGRSKYTIKAFQGDLRLLVSYLPPDRAIGAITTSELNNFLSWLESGRGISCSPKSLARRITSIKAFFRWLHQVWRDHGRSSRTCCAKVCDQSPSPGSYQ